MNALILTLMRFGFLALLWVFLAFIIVMLKRDLVKPVTLGATTSNAKVATAERKKRASVPGRITVLDGALAGTVITLTGPDVLFGRAADCSLVLNDDYVSNHHCIVTRLDDMWVLRDLGSTNGTWIDRSRVATTTPLKIGTVFNVGRLAMRVDA